MKKNKTKKVKKYMRMAYSMVWAFISTTLILILLFSGVAALLRKVGIDLGSGAFSAFFGFGLYLVGLVFTSALTYFATWNIFKPILSLSAATKKIADGDYSVQLKYEGSLAELAETIENFNYMVHELSSVEMIRNDFIANVSHEFKTPLSSLNGYLMLLQDSSLPEEERMHYFSKAFFSIEKLNDLTENILRLSRLEHQSSLDAPIEYRLDEQLRSAIVMLEPKWSSKDIEFDLDLPEVKYVGQRSLLFQVWTNIISNAIKFSPEESTITIRLEETENHFKVYISDEGIGMSEEQQRHIFDKFYQADTSRQSQGNGLGLALCKEIVTRCGGTIYVTSKPDEGSVFLITLKKVDLKKPVKKTSEAEKKNSKAKQTE